MPKPKVDVDEIKAKFCAEFTPLESGNNLLLFTDKRTGARFCECHIKGSTIVKLGTTEAPLDPEEQLEYKANRDIRVNNPAFATMKEDAKALVFLASAQQRGLTVLV